MNFRHDSFIHAEFIDTRICDNLVEWFNKTKPEFKPEGKLLKKGILEVDTDRKESIDLNIPCDSLAYPIGEYRQALQIVLENYQEKYPIVEKLWGFDILSHYNFQYYPPGGGYKELHAENSGGPKESARNLVFMTYLNDVPNGGTRFTAQDIDVEAEKGKTLIWPAYFTHEHVGIISNEHEKMIVTGWYEFRYTKAILSNYQDLKSILEAE